MYNPQSSFLIPHRHLINCLSLILIKLYKKLNTASHIIATYFHFCVRWREFAELLLFSTQLQLGGFLQKELLLNFLYLKVLVFNVPVLVVYLHSNSVQVHNRISISGEQLISGRPTRPCGEYSISLALCPYISSFPSLVDHLLSPFLASFSPSCPLANQLPPLIFSFSSLPALGSFFQGKLWPSWKTCAALTAEPDGTEGWPVPLPGPLELCRWQSLVITPLSGDIMGHMILLPAVLASQSAPPP